MTYDASSILIAGGYGLVGSEVARLIRARHPALPLVLGGRDPSSHARRLAEALSPATCVPLDVSADDPLAALELLPGAVVGAVNDVDDRLLLAALRHRLPYVDITRWTSLMLRATLRASIDGPVSPVLFSSAWMGGVSSLLALAAARRLESLDRIDVSILYGLADRAGPDSIAYVDRMAACFEVTENGTQRLVRPMTDGRRVDFPGGRRATVYRLDTPEQATLPLFTGAASVATRIGYDSPLATSSLVSLRRLGILRLLARDRFIGLRRRLLYSSGEGAPAILAIDAAGGGELSRVHAVDPSGQAHLTALGAVISLERVLGLDGAPGEPAGVRFPEQHPDLDRALETLRRHGVELHQP